MRANKKNLTTYQNVTCPFCSLHCDDLIIQNQAEQLKVNKNGCPKAISQFEQTQVQIQASIKNKKVSFEDAVIHASKLLRQAKQPLIAGLGTDVAGMRSVMQLADKTGAIIDHMHSDGAIRNIKVMQDYGWVMTTLAEIKNRADLIIFAGTNGIDNYPRFFERAIWNKNTLFKTNIKQRQIVYIGDQLNTAAGKIPTGRKPITINCKQDQIGEIVATLRALIAGHKIEQSNIVGIAHETLINLAEHMKQARYGVIVWAPGEMNFPHAELAIQAISGLIKYLNRTTRFAGFSLAGNDGGITATNVSAWQSGYPLRVNFANGFPEYDPYKYATKIVLKRKEADTLLWISSFSADIPPPKARIPTIVLTTPSTKLRFRPDVFIPVGTPGIDHSGQLFRTDSVVALPLKKVRNSNYSSVSKTINCMLELL
jgi:formylmethanofuran dehydrogenase subunit B